MRGDTVLLRALRAAATDAGCPAELLSADASEWASATFTGRRCRIALRIASSAARDLWIAGLPEWAWSIPGLIVADLAAEATPDVVTIYALTIDAS